MRSRARLSSARRRSALAGALVLASAGLAQAGEEPRERQLTPEEINAWLDSRAMPKSQSDTSGELSETLPPPPRSKGFVLESSIGVLGQLGHLKNIAPAAPWFGLRFGYEPLRWLMVFAESDLFLSNTSYAAQPPPPRTFAFWSAGGGLRLTVRPIDILGLYLQGSAGVGQATDDVLEIYGYPHADELGLYAGGELGVEWYQVSPHLALAVHGGARAYPRTLQREFDTKPSLAWLSGAALRYTF